MNWYDANAIGTITASTAIAVSTSVIAG